jgi:type VI secretion system secreted protein Hcp
MTVYIRFQRDGLTVMKGDSTAPGHEGWIEVFSFSIVATPLADSSGQGAPISLTTSTLVKLVDAISPQLQRESSSPTSMTINVDFTTQKDGTDQIISSYTVHEALISSYRIGSSGDGRATEEIGVSFTIVTVDPQGMGQDMSDQVNYFNDQVCYLDQ